MVLILGRGGLIPQTLDPVTEAVQAYTLMPAALGLTPRVWASGVYFRVKHAP